MRSFDVNKFVINFCESYDNKIIDRTDIPNVLLLDSYDLISIILRKKCNIFIQYDENNSKDFLDMLYLRVESTNAILRSLGNINYLILSKTQNSQNLKAQREHTVLVSDDFEQNIQLVLKKLETLRMSIKLSCEDLNISTIQADDSSVFFNKEIDQNRCTNCGNCVTYCPTQAFTYNEKRDCIFFESGRCIGCNICEKMCEENAVLKNHEIDLIAFAFGQKSKKIEFKSNFR